MVDIGKFGTLLFILSRRFSHGSFDSDLPLPLEWGPEGAESQGSAVTAESGPTLGKEFSADKEVARKGFTTPPRVSTPTRITNPTEISTRGQLDFVTPSPDRPRSVIRRSVSTGSGDDRSQSRLLFKQGDDASPLPSLDDPASLAELLQRPQNVRSTSWSVGPLHVPSPRGGSASSLGFSAYSPSRMFPAQILQIRDTDPLLSPRERAQSPITADFLRVFGSTNMDDILRDPTRSALPTSRGGSSSPKHDFSFSSPFRPQDPFSLFGHTMPTVEGIASLSPGKESPSSPRMSAAGVLESLGYTLADLVSLLSNEELFQDIVSFPVTGYIKEHHAQTLSTIHAYVDRMVGTVSSPRDSARLPRFFPPTAANFPTLFLESVCEDEVINNWARAIAEIFVETRNAKVVNDALRQKAAPFVFSFFWFIDQLGLDKTCFKPLVESNADLISRFLQLEPEYTDKRYFRFVTCWIRPLAPKFLRTDSLDSEIDRLLSLIADVRSATESWWLTTSNRSEVEPIVVTSPLFSSTEQMTDLVVGLLVEKNDLLRAHEKFNQVRTNFRDICAGFAGQFVHGLYKGTRIGLRESEPPVANVDIRITRVSVQLVSVCRSAISWTYKLDILPRLLQSGIRSVKGYRDSHVLFALPQNERMTEEFTNMMSAFNKLELMNDVIVQFSDSEAEGHTGPRREWLTRVIRDMTSASYGLFRASDERNLFLKPIEFPVDDEGMTEWMRDKFRIFGRVLGIAIRYTVTPGVRFTPGALWLFSTFGESTEIQPSLAVLEDLVLREDESIFQSINCSNLQDLGQTDEQVVLFRDFIPNHPRAEEQVTEANLAEFKAAYMHHFALSSIKQQMYDVYLGMSDTIRATILHSLVPPDFSELFVGSDSIDVEELLKNTSFDSSISRDNRRWLLEILRSFDQQSLEKFLLFVSASPKPPLGGFASVDKARKWLHVQNSSVRGDPDTVLPTTQTCFVVLRLPQYTSKERMRERIIYAITFANTIEM